MPLFSNLTLFRSYLSSLCLSNRIKRLACSGAYDPVFSLHFLKHGYVSIPNFCLQIFSISSSALSSALNHSTDLNITWHHQIPNVLGLPPIHFGTVFLIIVSLNLIL